MVESRVGVDFIGSADEGYLVVRVVVSVGVVRLWRRRLLVFVGGLSAPSSASLLPLEVVSLLAPLGSQRRSERPTGTGRSSPSRLP